MAKKERWDKVPKRIAKRIKKTRRVSKKHVDRLPIPKRCRYCKGRVFFETFQQGAYNQSVKGRYKCRKCGASVNCHAGTKLPMGILADRELRQLRSQAHNAMNWNGLSWKEKQRQYAKFGKHFGWKRRFHIGMLNKQQCRDLIKYINEQYGSNSTN